MQLQQLIYAVKLSEENSFVKAARALYISQPALTQQIMNLEDELHTQLFVRSRHSVKLTQSGKIFVNHANKILDQLEQLKVDVATIDKEGYGVLSIGSLVITAEHILPDVLMNYKKRYPNVHITLFEEFTDELLKLLEKEQIDIAICTLPIRLKHVEHVKILEEELLLAVPRDHRFAHYSSIDLAELCKEEFISLKSGQGFRQTMVDLCRDNGFTPNIIFESSNIEMIQALVAVSRGISIVPKMVADENNSQISYLRINGNPMRTLVAAYKSGYPLSESAHRFISLLQKMCAQQ